MPTPDDLTHTTPPIPHRTPDEDRDADKSERREAEREVERREQEKHDTAPQVRRGG